MRKLSMLLPAVLAALMFTSCGPTSDYGELVGVQGRVPWQHLQPYGMVYVPTGTFHMGAMEEEVDYSLTAMSKQVSVAAFFMDDTEISNNEYRQFVHYVRDSIAKKMLGEDHLIMDEAGNERLNWDIPIEYGNQETKDMLSSMYHQGDDKLSEGPELNTRDLKYKYYWVDLQQASLSKYKSEPVARSTFKREDEVAIYPDTLVFIRDFTYSYNEPMAQFYFFHPGYDDYPVVGIDWSQANAFCAWRTSYLDAYLISVGLPTNGNFRLPTEAEWEYAARGSRIASPYPWGGPYTRNSKGCFLANFKPLRGNYVQDGGFYPVKVNSYFPNDYGLYNMAGNVAEWTISAYDQVTYPFVDDMNPDYKYNVKEGDPVTLQRKVIRGGSWKDVAHYTRNGTRTFEYQDSAKSYIGFRCAQSFIGRSIND